MLRARAAKMNTLGRQIEVVLVNMESSLCNFLLSHVSYQERLQSR